MRPVEFDVALRLGAHFFRRHLDAAFAARRNERHGAEHHVSRERRHDGGNDDGGGEFEHEIPLVPLNNAALAVKFHVTLRELCS